MPWIDKVIEIEISLIEFIYYYLSIHMALILYEKKVQNTYVLGRDNR